MVSLHDKVTAGIAALIVAAVLALVVLRAPVPEPLWAGFGLVLGFYFGNQAGRAVARAR